LVKLIAEILLKDVSFGIDPSCIRHGDVETLDCDYTLNDYNWVGYEKRRNTIRNSI
jgi:hypothetical protein